jgi:hypothetical protein
MLTKADDYPIHQTPEPIAYSGTDRNFYDRYFFNGYAKDGSLFFAAALGVYPHVNVMDGAFCFIVDGRQHSVFGSRVLHMERLDTRVGPIEVEVIQPLEVLRVVANDPKNGLKADLRFTGRVKPIEEPRFTRRMGSWLAMDLTRLTQNGTWEGTIELKGKKHEIKQDRVWGTRDRSWGIRGIGARDPQPNPYAGEPQFYWLWSPLNFENAATFYHVNTDAKGEPWNTRGVIAPTGGGADAEEMEDVSSRIEFKSGTRHAKRAHIELTRKSGKVAKITLEPLYHFYMKGIGYGHPKWSHGTYHGELDTGYEELSLADAAPTDPTNLHIQAICNATLDDGGTVSKGTGVLEQMIIGKHEPSGFKQTLDMAP